MASNMTLYMRNGACSFIPHVLLNEIKASYKTFTMDFDKDTRLAAADGSFTHDDYKKIHHAGHVPALQVGNESITELPAICNYIARLKPEEKLTGNTLLEQAKHEELMCYMNGELHAQGFAALWRSRRFTDSADQAVHEGIQAGGKKRILAALDRLEGLLKGTHAIGDNLTVADVTIYNYWRWGALRMGFESEEFQKKYPKLTALAKEIESVPSVRKTLEEEKLPLGFA